MSDAIAAEFLKLRTTRTFWWLSGVAVGLPVLLTVATLATVTPHGSGDARSLISNVGIAGLWMIILGVVGAAGEYRHGTITSTFLTVPDRARVTLAKALAHALAGLCVGAVCAAAVLAITIPVLSAQGQSLASLGIGGGDIARTVAGSLAYIALAAALGVGLGALLANQVAAVVLVLAVLFVVDPVVASLASAYGRFSFQGLGMALSGTTSSSAGYELFPIGVAALVFAGYAVVLVAASALVSTRRDVA